MKGFLLIFGTAGLLVAGSPELERARNLYDLTAFDQSLRVLEAIPAKDAAVYDLMGRDYYMQGDYKRSTEAMEKALAAEPGDAVHALWLGRAYGRRAEAPACSPRPATRQKRTSILNGPSSWIRATSKLCPICSITTSKRPVSGRRDGEGAAHGGPNRRTQSGRGLPGEGQAGREAQRIFHR